MSDTETIKDMLVQQNESFTKFKQASDNRLATVESDLKELVKRDARSALLGKGDHQTTPAAQFIDARTGRAIQALEHKDQLASVQRKGDTPSVGRLLRGLVLGGRAHDAAELAEERKDLSVAIDPSGGYTIGGAVADLWIDSLRAASVLSKAGCLTLPMENNQLTIARIASDPECFWHTENAAVTAGDPTFGAANLKAKTVVCLVKMSVELTQDSVNLEQQLSSAISNALAAAIDSAGLVGVTTNAAAAPAGVMNLTNRNRVTAIGAPTSWDFLVDGMYELANSNIPLDRIGALVAHPAVWRKMRKLKTGITSDNTPLTMPAEIAALTKLWTTAAPLVGGATASGVIGDWRDLILGIRKDITVRVLSESFLGGNLQIAILAYARCDFAATREASFCTLEGITV